MSRFVLLALLLMPLPALAAEVELSAVADVSADSRYATQNFGSAPSVDVGGLNEDERIAFVKFNLSSIPDNAIIDEADLKMRMTDGQMVFNSAVLNASLVTQAWTEASVSYSIKPAYDPSIGIRQQMDLRFVGEKTFNVTEIASAWVREGKNNYGIAVYADGHDSVARFTSREGGSPPKLRVKYHQPLQVIDTQAPEIVEPEVELLSTVSADVKWRTYEEATGIVKFGTDGQYDRQSFHEGYMEPYHVVRLDGLEPGETYNYAIYSKDRTGNESRYLGTFSEVTDSSSYQSASSGAQYNEPEEDEGDSANEESEDETQRVFNVIYDRRDNNSVRFTWNSSLSGTSWVFVSSSADEATPVENYEIIEGVNDEVTAHEIWVYNLLPETTYSYKVASRSADGQIAFSARQEFETYVSVEGDVDDGEFGFEEEVSLNGYGQTSDELRDAIRAEVAQRGNGEADVNGVEVKEDSFDVEALRSALLGGGSSGYILPRWLKVLLWVLLLGVLVAIMGGLIVGVWLWRRKSKKEERDREDNSAGDGAKNDVAAFKPEDEELSRKTSKKGCIIWAAVASICLFMLAVIVLAASVLPFI